MLYMENSRNPHCFIVLNILLIILLSIIIILIHCRTKPRQPVGLPKVLLVVGGQAPKAIRSVECYDFKEERWYQVAEMPTRRCRAGLAVLAGKVYAVSMHMHIVTVCDLSLGVYR